MQQAKIADAAEVFGADGLALEPLPAHPVVPAAPPAPAAQVMSPHQMVQMAVEKGMSLETIDKLLGMAERVDAMREAERKRLAESAYMRAIAGLKADVVTVAKTKLVHYDTKDKDGRKNGSVNFKHAELSDIMKAIAGPAKREGLTWNYPAIDQGDDWVRVTCKLRHVDGHFEELTLGCPVDKSGKKNDMQAIAAAITYMQRYTLKAILGIAEEGDDTADARAAAAAHGDADGAVQSVSVAGTPQFENLMHAGSARAGEGLKSLTDWWGKLSKDERDLVGAKFGELKKAAQAVKP